MLFGAGWRSAFFSGRDQAAARRKIELELPGGAHHERRVDRHTDRPVARHRRCAVFSGMDAGQNDRRPAGVARWRHPGIEAEIRRHDHTVPIESRRDPMPAFAASGNKGCDRRDQHQSAQRIGIAAGEAWCRRAGAQGIGILQ